MNRRCRPSFVRVCPLDAVAGRRHAARIRRHRRRGRRLDTRRRSADRRCLSDSLRADGNPKMSPRSRPLARTWAAPSNSTRRTDNSSAPAIRADSRTTARNCSAPAAAASIQLPVKLETKAARQEILVEFERFTGGIAEKEARRMNRFLDWLDHRTGFRGVDARRALRAHSGRPAVAIRLGQHARFCFFVQVVTGLILWAAYSPSAQTAWESVYYIQHQMTAGWLLRGVHHFTAAGDGRAHGDPLRAGRDRRRVSRAARNQFLARPHPDADRARPRAHRLPAAVGPKRLLGDEGRHEDDGPGAGVGRIVAADRSSAAASMAITR